MTTEKIIEFVSEYYRNKGCIELEPVGLISPAFPTMFNPSAGHTHILQMLSKNSTGEIKPGKYFVLDRCLRAQDLGLVGLSHYLSFFEMFTAFSILPDSIGDMLQDFYNIFIKSNLIKKEDLLITVFGGAKIGGLTLPEDNETSHLWQKIGIPSENIVKTPGEVNFAFPKVDNDLAYLITEIYYIREKFSLPLAKYIEIATIEFSTHKIKKINGNFNLVQLPKGKFFVNAWAFGLERMAMILNRNDVIYQVDTFEPLVENIKQQIIEKKTAEIFSSEIYCIADHIRGIIFAIADGQKPEHKGRGNILRKMIKVLISKAKSLDLDNESFYERLIDITIKIYHNHYPHLKEAHNNILETFFAERERSFRQKGG